MSKEKWNNEHYVSCHFFWMSSIAFGSGDRWSLIAKLFQLIRQCDRIIPTTTTQSKQQFIDKWNIVSVAIGFHSMKVQWMHVCVARSPIRYKKQNWDNFFDSFMFWYFFFSNNFYFNNCCCCSLHKSYKHFVFYFFSFEFVLFFRVRCTLIYNVVRSIEK